MPDHQLPEVSLANEEWDFSGCPNEEIFDCWVYEFATNVTIYGIIRICESSILDGGNRLRCRIWAGGGGLCYYTVI